MKCVKYVKPSLLVERQEVNTANSFPPLTIGIDPRITTPLVRAERQEL